MMLALATKADFSADERSLIVEGPPLAGMGMLVAEHGGQVREVAAIAATDEIVRESLRINRTRFGSPDAVNSEELMHGAGTCLREAVETLERKAEVDDVADHRRFVLGLAQHVAESWKEGSFLGVGGNRVSEDGGARRDRRGARRSRHLNSTAGWMPCLGRTGSAHGQAVRKWARARHLA
jgi:hypothetical protein